MPTDVCVCVCVWLAECRPLVALSARRVDHFTRSVLSLIPDSLSVNLFAHSQVYECLGFLLLKSLTEIRRWQHCVLLSGVDCRERHIVRDVA